MSEGEALVRPRAAADTLVRMPKLADTLVEGTVGQWFKQVGEAIGKGEPLASIETDKVTTEVSSPTAGTVLELLVAAGSTVAIETPIARIGEPVIHASDRVTPKPTPLAAKLLAEHGLTPDQVPAHSNRLTRNEVLAFVQAQPVAASAPPPVPLGDNSAATRAGGAEQWSGLGRADGNLIPLSPMRRAIADHLTRAHQTIPHGQTVMDADLSGLVTWRDQHKDAFLAAEGANLTFTVFFVYALARSLATYTRSSVDIGVAVALEAGLIVPVLRAADSLSLAETARGIAELAQRARTNKLAAGDTQGATMTVTNVGSFGNLTASPIIPVGQIGILGPGLVERRPLPGPDGAIRPGWRCLLSLVFDRRRLTDFAADRLLRTIVTQLVHLPTLGALPEPLQAQR
jgi:2-oxoisovalerate dehydrogenase E2 component (dihydrolipoyl transacylase)